VVCRIRTWWSSTTSGPVRSNEAAFLYQLFGRRNTATKQFSRNCSKHVPRGDQCRLNRWSIGIGKGHRLARRFRALRTHHRHGTQSRHESSSAHDGHSARGFPAAACRSSCSIRSGSARSKRFNRSAKPGGNGQLWFDAHRVVPITRSKSAAMPRLSRAS